MKKKYNVAIVGATGAVGQTMLQILEERNFPVNNILPLASSRSNGNVIKFCGKEVKVQEASPSSFSGIDIALFSAGKTVSTELAPEAVKHGAVVIDNSNAFRLDNEVPLIVPEVNPEDLKGHKGIIANPNCSTIQMVVVLKPIHDAVKVKRVVVSTYQAVSGTGLEAIEELKTQSKAILEGEEAVKNEVYPYQIAFNTLPHIDVFDDTGYSLEEWKMVNETKKILDKTISVTATTVRVPVINCHSEAVNVETYEKISVEKVREILAKAPGVKVEDAPKELKYPMPIYVSGKDDVYVGRIREDFSIDCGLNLWIVGDNLRKGAALNAIQIAETMIKDNLI